MKKNRPRVSQTPPEASSLPEGSEVYEVFVAELEARRRRLGQLLEMVTLEASRTARQTIGDSPHLRCRRTRSRIG